MKRLYDEVLTGLFDGCCVGFIAYIVYSLIGIRNEFLFSLNTLYPLPLGDVVSMLNWFVMGAICGIVVNTCMPTFHFTSFQKEDAIKNNCDNKRSVD
jgi:hypothetical protein